MPESRWWAAGEAVVAVACVTAFIALYLASTIEYDRATLAGLVEGTAWKPFVMRVLTPSLARAARDFAGIPTEWFAAVLGWVATLWCWVAFRSWALHLWPEGRTARLAPLLLMGAFLANLVVCTRFAYRYPYDLPATAFFLTGLLACRNGRHGLFYGVFLAGLLNRESILLLVPACILLRWDRDRPRTLVLHALIQILLGLGAKMALAGMFRDNPGEAFENHLWGNLEIFLKPFTEGEFGDLISSLACCGFLWAVVPIDWRGQPAEVKRLTLLWLPFLAVHLVTSNLIELRIYGELAPIVAMGAVHPLRQVILELRGRKQAEKA